jgi:HK97 family phage major capsid protein
MSRDTTVESKALKAKVSVNTTGDERKVTFVVSSNGLDRDYERVDVKSLRIPLKGGGYVVAKELNGSQTVDVPWLLNHSFDVEDVIGSVRTATYDAATDELVFEFGVSQRAKAQDMLLLIEEGHLDNAVSITMSDYTLDDNTSTIYDAEIIEVSLVFRGSNKQARLLAVKSLIKGEDMADAKTLAEKKAELEALSKEIAEAEAQEAENKPADQPAAEPQEQPEVVKPDQPEPPKEDAPQADDVEEPQNEPEPEEQPPQETKAIKQDNKPMSKDIAVKQVKDVPTVEEAPQVSTMSKNAQRALFVEQFMAAVSNDRAKLADLNKKAFEADTRKTKIMGEGGVGVDTSQIYQTEVVSWDIREAYDNAGKLSSLVNRIDILGAEKWKALNQVDGVGFRPVGFGGVKDEDNMTFTTQLVEPHEHALIVAWYDQIAKKTPLAVYTQVVRYIAKMYIKLEDKIILTFAGGTFDSEVYEVTGLQPLLTTAGGDRVVTWDGTPEGLQAAFGTTYGNIESDDDFVLVTNRKMWGQIATLVASDGRYLFTQVGENVSAGALGSFRVIVTNEVADDNIVVGVMSDYDLVTRGSLETLFSREASVGSVNLYTQDASALRADVAISGAPRALESFVLLQRDVTP